MRRARVRRRPRCYLLWYLTTDRRTMERRSMPPAGPRGGCSRCCQPSRARDQDLDPTCRPQRVGEARRALEVVTPETESISRSRAAPMTRSTAFRRSSCATTTSSAGRCAPRPRWSLVWVPWGHSPSEHFPDTNVNVVVPPSTSRSLRLSTNGRAGKVPDGARTRRCGVDSARPG